MAAKNVSYIVYKDKFNRGSGMSKTKSMLFIVQNIIYKRLDMVHYNRPKYLSNMTYN